MTVGWFNLSDGEEVEVEDDIVAMIEAKQEMELDALVSHK